ncbi:putative peptidoglycan glycosyltransferase FtsW [Anaerolineae bacterium]|nr:putative peptidoglycan glycosyltransferase FtsW [Anaerolineae bacterium]
MTAQQNTRWINNAFRVDYVLFGVVTLLVIVGLVMVWSVTFPPRVGMGLDDPLAVFVKQAQFAVIGLFALVIFSQVDYRLWGRLAIPMMLGTLAVLGVLLFLPETFGARRWLFGGSVQPAEIAKFAIIVYMARWLSSKGEKLRQVTYGLLPFAVIVGAVCGLIVLQPNISTAIIIALCAIAMFFIAGADLVQFAFLLIVGGVTGMLVVLKMPHSSARLLTFVQDPLSLGKEGYQVIETLIALGSGGFFGRGLGSGYAKFGYVPAAHTDSIFAMLGEETGLVGTFAVLALYLALAYRGFRIASKASDPFGQVLAAGLTFWLIFQAFINIGVVTASIPFTGVPLPFISFGGSSLIAALVAVGVLLNISRQENAPKVGNSLQGKSHATLNLGWRNGGTRVPRVSRSRRTAETRGR